MNLLKRIATVISTVFVSSLLLASDTVTTRMGLTQPEQGSSGWATKLNDNFDIIDSSAAILGGTNAFTGTNSFAGTVTYPNLTASQCLTLDGSNQVTTQACSTPPGSDTQVIYNQGGVFAGDADFTFNGTTASITGVASSTMTINRIVWPDGTVQVSSPTSTAGAAGADGTSVYPATATASFPYGLSASTISVSTAAITTLTDGAGSSIMTTGASTQLIVSSITFPDGTVIGSTSPFSESIDAILNQSTLQTGTSFYVHQGQAKKIIVDSTFTVTGTSITLGNTSSQLDIPAMGTVSNFMRAGNGNSLITSYDLLNGTQTWTGGNTFSSMTASSNVILKQETLQSGATFYVSSGTVTNLYTSSFTISTGYLSNRYSLFPFVRTAGFTRDSVYEHAQINSSLGVGLGDYYLLSSSTGTTFDTGAKGGVLRLGPGSAGSYLGYGDPVSGPSTGIGILESGATVTSPILTVTYGVSAATVSVTDDAYAAGWNGSTLVPTKNAVYDKIETLSLSGASTASTNTWTAGQTFISSVTMTGGLVLSSGVITGPLTAGTSGQALVSRGPGLSPLWTGGRIMQVVPFSNSSSSSTTGTTFINSNVAVTITPLSAGSTIYILSSIHTDVHVNAAATTGMDLKWVRGTYPGTALSSAKIFGSVNAHGSGTAVADDQWAQVPIIDYDAPGTTSATTYTLQFRNSAANANTVYVNETSFSSNGATSSGILVEIGP